MDSTSWVEARHPFLEHLAKWFATLPASNLAALLHNPSQTAIVSVDVVNGFCYEGPVASARVSRIIQPIVVLFRAAWDLGARHILLTQDCHPSDAVEFFRFPSHCLRGSSQAEPVHEFKALPFFDELTIVEKNSLSSTLNTTLTPWIDAHPAVTQYIAVGDCTDFCLYQLAMQLRLDANARQLERRVILPVDCVDTFDTPITGAIAGTGIGYPHDAELFHRVFLYNMALNGIEVVATLC
jgi:nicotinamidase-related amidase